MWTIKKLSDKTSKAMDSMFESMDGMFEKMNEIVSDVVSDDDDLLETEGVFKVDSDEGVISITANNGHLIIEGPLKSLRVNGDLR